MDLYYTGLPDALETLGVFFFFVFFFFSFLFFLPAYYRRARKQISLHRDNKVVLYSLFGWATCSVSVWNGGLTESTASVNYLHRVLD